MVGGVALLFFVVFHLLHFTTGTLHFDNFQHGRVYSNVHNAFQHGYLVVIYLAALGFMAFHLYHGIWSLFQTLGLNAPERDVFFKGLAAGSAVILFLGFAAVPVSILSGLLPTPLP